MDRLFGEIGGGTSARPFRVAFLPGRGARVYPLANIYQDGDDFRVEALAPGLDLNGVEVTAVRNTLTIRGEKVGLRDLAPERVHRSERAAGRFMRTVELPDDVDPDKVTAQYRDGLLIITAPRAAHARPRHVTVQADSGVDQRRVSPSPPPSETRARKRVKKGNGRLTGKRSAEGEHG
jgi:HSP20 family protein